MILESKDVFDQLAQFDPNSGNYRFFSRKQHPELTTKPTSGGYSVIDGTTLVLYRKDGPLHLRIGDCEFELTDDVTSTLTRENDSRVFRLIQEENSLVVFKYVPPVPEIPISADPTPFIEEEDFDFLLFVHRVLTEPGRRNRVYRQ